MTIQRNINISGNSGNWVPYNLRGIQAAAGWTTVASGSGKEGYSGAGWAFSSVVVGSDIVRPTETHPPPANVGVGFGSEAFGGPSCWFVMRDPSGAREWCFLRSSSQSTANDIYWRISYSPSEGFGDSYDEETPPTAPDEVQLWSIFSPIFAAGSDVIHIAADDVASPGGEYGFLVVEFVATNTTRGMVFADDLRDVAAGDGCPLVVGVSQGARTAAAMSGNTLKWALVDVGGPGESFETVGYTWPRYGSAYWGAGAKSSKYDGDERPIPCHAVASELGGYLGESRWFLASADDSHGYPDTGDSGAFLFVDDLLIRDLWDGASTPTSI